MPAYILTGAPGSGKTVLLRQLEIDGHAVVEEAATDVIALQQALGHPEPWRESGFADLVVALQKRRRLAAPADPRVITFYDRSPICTLALCRYLRIEEPVGLHDEIERMVTERPYEKTAIFVRNQGAVAATTARRISFEESLVFENVHERVYREAGFTLLDVPAAPVPERTALIRQFIDHHSARDRSSDVLGRRLPAGKSRGT